MGMIPKRAKKVFHGEIFKIYQWEQKMFDNTTKTFEAGKSLEGVGVIAAVGDKIVVLKQKQPGTKWYYSLPGGYLDDPAETIKQGAARELMEETGLKAKTMKFWKTMPRGGRIESNLYLFIARDCTKVAEQNLDGGEKIQIELRTFEQFLKLSDSNDFHHPRLISEMLRARMSKKNTQAFKKLIFG
jgi:ADP-ribose pyrophosphatase